MHAYIYVYSYISICVYLCARARHICVYFNVVMIVTLICVFVYLRYFMCANMHMCAYSCPISFQCSAFIENISKVNKRKSTDKLTKLMRFDICACALNVLRLAGTSSLWGQQVGVGWGGRTSTNSMMRSKACLFLLPICFNLDQLVFFI